MRFMLDGLEVFFPYEFIYKEQYTYMKELKVRFNGTYYVWKAKALDASGDCLLEMPTGTGKTVTLLALITSFQFAHPEAGKLIYCTRTVPEMTKAVEELKRVVSYRREELLKDAVKAGASQEVAAATASAGDLLGLCLSSRRNMCIHPRVVDESDREKVDALCRNMTASWVRSRAETDPTVKLCEFFENYEHSGTDADLRGIFTLDDLKKLGEEKGWCPYFLARHALSFANVVVYNYQYMLDPKIANLVSRELEDKSIVVFDEAHNIDNVCIEALSVTLDRATLEGAARNLGRLASDVKRMRETNVRRLQEEYARLASGLGLTAGGALAGAHAGGRRDGEPSSSALASLGASAPPAPPSQPAAAVAATSSSSVAAAAADAGAARLAGGEELLGAPVLPTDVAEQAIPGNIRNAELFVRFMRHVVRFFKDRIKVAQVESETPAAFLHRMGTTLSVDPKPLRFAYSRLNSLLRTLEITDVDEFAPISLVSDFATLLTTYPKGFMVILEPFNSRTPHIPDPIMQLACLDASLAVRPVFQKFQSVILTSGTLSPLDMYPKILNFNPVVRASFEMSLTRPCILPIMVTKGRDQSPLSTKFEMRDDQNVIKNYGDMVIQFAKTVPDGMVVFFPSYSYMETIITAWHEWGVLEQVEAHKLLFIETKDIVATTLSLGSFRRACDSGRGAVFFSIARGKVAEGIDFDRHYGRIVVLIGVPFQYTLSHVLRARLAYMRDNYHIREQDFLTFDALRNSSQCIGRVIRSKRDYGIMVFADMRYARQDKRSKLPQWVLQALSPAHLALTPELAATISARFLREMAQPMDTEAAIGKSLFRLEHLVEMEAKQRPTLASGAAASSSAGASAVAAIRAALATAPAGIDTPAAAAAGAVFALEAAHSNPVAAAGAASSAGQDDSHGGRAGVSATAAALGAVAYPPVLRAAAGSVGVQAAGAASVMQHAPSRFEGMGGFLDDDGDEDEEEDAAEFSALLASMGGTTTSGGPAGDLSAAKRSKHAV